MVPENVSHLCLPDLPHMVTLITKLTSLLNSHQKLFPKNVSHLCVCWTCHTYMVTLMMKLTSPLNSCQKMVPKDDEDSMGTPQGLHKTLKGLSRLLSRLCKVHGESMRSPWECVGECKIQCLRRLSCPESWSLHCI